MDNSTRSGGFTWFCYISCSDYPALSLIAISNICTVREFSIQMSSGRTEPKWELTLQAEKTHHGNTEWSGTDLCLWTLTVN